MENNVDTAVLAVISENKAFLDRAKGADVGRPEICGYIIEGNRVMTTDGHRLHAVEFKGSLAPGLYDESGVKINEDAPPCFQFLQPRSDAKTLSGSSLETLLSACHMAAGTAKIDTLMNVAKRLRPALQGSRYAGMTKKAEKAVRKRLRTMMMATPTLGLRVGEYGFSVEIKREIIDLDETPFTGMRNTEYRMNAVRRYRNISVGRFDDIQGTPEVETAVNAAYVMDAIGFVDAIEISIGNGVEPIVITFESSTVVIMPMVVK